ncbi:MAG: lamin tail domain-containing protein [Bacteroidota bacterium]|nr:lamin tail domain-containing protein [Bacteroidota bacterium]
MFSQIAVFPYKENFDLLSTPALPFGWTTTTNKNINGDFTTDSSTSFSGHSKPKFVVSSDATKQQSLISPQFNFTGRTVDTIEFYERRVTAHNSGVMLEASIDGDSLFSIQITDTIKAGTPNTFIRRPYKLPIQLNNQSNVRFRWRIIGNGTSSASTTVIRFDDIRITTTKTIDLALASLSISSFSPKQGDQITAAVTISNRALAGNFSGSIQLFDSLTLIASQNFNQPFAVNESLTISFNYANIKAGRHPLTAKLILSGDEDTSNNSLTTVVNVGFQSRTVLINEFMYAPPSGMTEWVECINNSNDTIPLSGWKISDAGTTKALLQPVQQIILPHSYFIVTTDTNSLKDHYSISVPLLQASFSALNNTTADAVVVFDPTNSMIDSVIYSPSWGGSGGKSLERIDTSISSTLQSNWKTSVHPLGATPGVINSVTQKTFDIAVHKMTIAPQFPVTGNSIELSSIIKNIGKQNISAIHVELFVDANNDSVLTVNELQFQQDIASLTTNDSATIMATLSPLPQGIHLLGVKTSTTQDEDTSNNIMFLSVTIGISPKSIVVNEIMYAPLGDMPEWIELYNTGNTPISISRWKISDNGSTKTSITNFSALIGPHSYCTIAADSTFINFFSTTVPVFVAPFSALNNITPDAVVVYDERGATMDSVYFKQSWGGLNGTSLQRFDFFGASSDSSNWKIAAPNPGEENPSARKEIDVEVKNVSTSRTANGIQITTTIFNSGRQTANLLTIKFYHDKNNDSAAEQNELIDSSFIPTLNPLDSATTLFNWTVHIQGIQSIIVTAKTADDMQIANNSKLAIVKNNFIPQSLVINEIMYEPFSGKAEFVELFNRTADTVDIAEWKLMDQPSSSGSRAIILLSDRSVKIPPSGFVLIASDSSIFTQFPSLAAQHVIVNTSLSLNNSGEDLVLADLTNTQIDSMRYSPLWHLKNTSPLGRSLERINPSILSNDSRNWSSSVSSVGATPAAANSIFTKSVIQNSLLNLSPNPFSPDNDGFEDFLSINYSLPANSATIRVRVYDVTGRLIRRLAQSEPSPSTGSIIWNGMDDDAHRVRIGMYIILFEALDNFGGTAKTMKDVAVVARKL